MPSGAIKCDGAPQKIMYLAADYFRHRRRDKDIRLIPIVRGDILRSPELGQSDPNFYFNRVAVGIQFALLDNLRITPRYTRETNNSVAGILVDFNL